MIVLLFICCNVVCIFGHDIFDRGIVQLVLQAVQSQYYNPQYDRTYTITNAALPLEERAYLQQRLRYSAQVFAHKTGRKTTTFPSVALCCSGGGLRALISTLGFLHALRDAQLSDYLSYISSLSGSSWAISGLLQSGLTCEEYRNYLKKTLAIGLLEQIDMTELMQEILKKLSYSQELSIADIWGSFIAQKIIYNTHKTLSAITLDTYNTLPDNGAQPIPLYSNVLVNQTTLPHSYQWVEWNPWSVSAPFLTTALAVEALGRVFNQGISTEYKPPYSLSYCLGTWGSAMSVDGQDLAQQCTQNQNLGAFHRYLLYYILLCVRHNYLLNAATSLRIFPAMVPNWNYAFSHKPLEHTDELMLIDAGIKCNVPVPPLLERSVDLMIVLDVSWQSDIGAELQCCKEYADAHQLPFPQLELDKLHEPYSVHQDPAKKAPTILYMPMVPNDQYKEGWDPLKADFTNTFNLKYTPEEFDLLYGYAYSLGARYAPFIEQMIAQHVAASTV